LFLAWFIVNAVPKTFLLIYRRSVSPLRAHPNSALQDKLQELTMSRDEEKIAAQQAVVNKLQVRCVCRALFAVHLFCQEEVSNQDRAIFR